MYPVHPRNRNHKLQLISFKEAVDHLPKWSKKPKKTTKQKRVASWPVPISTKNNFSAFTAPLVPKVFKPMPKTQSKTRNTANYQRDPSSSIALQVEKFCQIKREKEKRFRRHSSRLNRKLMAETTISFSRSRRIHADALSPMNTSLPGELPLKLKPIKETDTTQDGFSTHKKALEKEREATRNSLLKLEKEVDGRENHKLCGCHLAYEYAPLPGELPYLRCQFGLKLKPIKETEKTQDGFSSCKRALEKEREAARNSLLKLEKEADGRDNHQLFKELEKLCGCHLAYEYTPLLGELPYLQRQFGLKLKTIKETEKTQDGLSSCKKALKKEREAAQNSLLKLEKEADGRDNHQLFKELEKLCGCHLAYEYAPLSGKLPYLQQHFGLKLKPATKTKEKAGANLDHSLSDKRAASASYQESPPYENDKEKAATALHYEKLMAWMPPSSSSHNDELEDWLFKPKQPAAKRQKVKSEDDDYVSSCLQQQPPRARFLAEAQIYALPYKLPF